jgi:hypothetical protein
MKRTGSGAIFSPCRKWRYVLWRIWEPVDKFLEGERMIVFIGLNPSTADEHKNDPTVSRCVRMARDWGFPGMFMLNAFAYRATDPQVMKVAMGPVGAMNDAWIKRIAGH